MSAIDKLKKFKSEFLKLTADSVNSGVPIQNVILELEQEKFRLQTFNLSQQMQQEAMEASKAIVTAGFALPPFQPGSNKN